MRKQNKYSPNTLAAYTPTTKSLAAVTGAAQDPAELVRLGKVRAAEVQKPFLYFSLLPPVTHAIFNG